MPKLEAEITREFMLLIVQKFVDEKSTTYEALRVLRYVLVALAEVLPEKLPWEHDGAQAK